MADTTTTSGTSDLQPCWDDDPEAWDTCLIDYYPIPGTNLEVSCPLEMKVEKKEVKGKDGARVTENGEALIPVTITFDLYGFPDGVDWYEWQTLKAVIWPRKKGGKRTPHRIEYPKTASNGITQIYVEKIDERGPKDGIMSVTITAFDWNIVPPEAPKPKAKASPATPRNYTPTDPAASAAAAQMWEEPDWRKAAQEERDDAVKDSHNAYGSGEH